MFPLLILLFMVYFVILIVLFLLSRHSTHSSDEAGFNDPSLLENLQSNHVSSASASFLPSAGLLGRRKILKSDFVRLCNGSLSFQVDLSDALFCCTASEYVCENGLLENLQMSRKEPKNTCNNETAIDWWVMRVSQQQDCVGEAGCHI